MKRQGKLRQETGIRFYLVDRQNQHRILVHIIPHHNAKIPQSSTRKLGQVDLLCQLSDRQQQKHKVKAFQSVPDQLKRHFQRGRENVP
ncbi:unknown [Clostridium sp. CAG:448]|nr:unknown [Clostridium sp. CAG:448]